MSRAGAFGPPYCVGFGEIERLLERAAKTSTEAYPPVNVEEPSEGHLCVTLAVAGFPPELLSLTLAGRELTVKGERPHQDEKRVYLHKGIAARGFQRTFILAEGLEIERARLLNGLLRIEMKHVRQNPQIRQIPITMG